MLADLLQALKAMIERGNFLPEPDCQERVDRWESEFQLIEGSSLFSSLNLEEVIVALTPCLASLQGGRDNFHRNFSRGTAGFLLLPVLK